MSPECGSRCRVGVAFRAFLCLIPASFPSSFSTMSIHCKRHWDPVQQNTRYFCHAPYHPDLSTFTPPPLVTLSGCQQPTLPSSCYLTRQKCNFQTPKSWEPLPPSMVLPHCSMSSNIHSRIIDLPSFQPVKLFQVVYCFCFLIQKLKSPLSPTVLFVGK